MKMDDGGPNLQASDLYCEHTYMCKCNTTTMASGYRGLWFEAELDAIVSCNTIWEFPDELDHSSSVKWFLEVQSIFSTQ